MTSIAFLSTVWWSLSTLAVLMAVEGTKLLILHTNDVNFNVNPFDDEGRTCWNDEDDYCYGGIWRHLTLVRQQRSVKKNVLFFDTGNYFRPNPWYRELGASGVEKLLRMLSYDAMVPGLIDLLVKDYTRSPELKRALVCTNCRDVQRNRTFLVRENTPIGVIGIVSPKMHGWIGADIDPGPMKVHLAKEMKVMKAKNVKIIILLSRATLEENLEIAKEFPDIDVIVGGLRAELFYKAILLPRQGVPATGDKVAGPYPVVVKSGKSRTLLLQVGQHGKYMGKLAILFDRRGVLVKWKGNPVFVYSQIAKEPNITDYITETETNIIGKYSTIIGRSDFLYNSDDCKKSVCPMGVLTYYDLYSSFPFNMNYALVWMNSSDIGALIHTSRLYSSTSYYTETVLQYSGIRFKFGPDIVGRGTELDIRIFSCEGCRSYRNLFKSKRHLVVIPESMLEDDHDYAYEPFLASVARTVFDTTDIEAMKTFLSSKKKQVLIKPHQYDYHITTEFVPYWLPDAIMESPCHVVGWRDSAPFVALALLVALLAMADQTG